MSRIANLMITLSFLLLTLLASSAWAVDIRVVPDTTEILPGQALGVNILLENVPATGLSAVQFRLQVVAAGGVLSGVGDLDQSLPGQVGIAAPLNASTATSKTSGLGGFLLSQAGPNGILLLDNPSFAKNSFPSEGSGFFSFARTAAAAPLQGSGVLARFMLKVGSEATVTQLVFSLTDVVVLDGDLSVGPKEYNLENILGSTVAVGCETQVPALLGLSRDNAVQLLTASGLALGASYEVENLTGDKALGVVLEQSLSAGQYLACGQQVNLAINLAPYDVGSLQASDVTENQSGEVNLTWAASPSVDVAKYEIYQDTSLLQTVVGRDSTGCIVTGLINGQSNLLRVVAIDNSGNRSTGASVAAVPLDDVAPELSLSRTLPALTNQVSLSFSGSVDIDADLNVENLSSGASASITFPVSGSWQAELSLVEGENQIRIAAQDSAGNLVELLPSTIIYQPSQAPLRLELQAESITSGQTTAFAGTVTLAVPGGALWLEQFVDENNNGSIEEFEPVVRRLSMSDEDNDGVATTNLNMLNVLAIDHAPGNYLFRVTDGAAQAVKPFRVDPIPQPQTLQGQITDGINGLAGVQVQLIDKWQRPVAWAITDVNGNYLFQVPEAGGYYLLPQADGYAFDRNTASLVSVVASASTTAPAVEMAAGANTISGQVFSDATALVGIRVVATGSLGNGYVASALTGNDGAYSLSLPVGDYTIQVVADSYAGPSTRGCLADATTDVSLTVASNQGGINFNLPAATVTVSGVVADETMMPIVGVSVIALSNDEIVAMTTTAADGGYSLPLAENSNYTVTVESDSATSLGYVGQQFVVQTGTSDVSGQNLPIHSISNWINGTVTDESSSPLMVMPVHLRSGGDLYRLSTNTTVDGDYLFGAFAGTWYVRAETEAQGYSAAAETDLVLSAGQTGTVDFIAVASGGDATCLECHSVMTESTTCLDCHDWAAGANNQHHEAEVSNTWGFGCMDCHAIGPDPITGSYGLLNPSPVACSSCHVSLDPERPAMDVIHHTLPATGP